jgi:hypothetical protein
VNPKIRDWLIVIVVVAWVTNLIASGFVDSYDPPPEVNVGFGIIIGALSQIKTRSRTEVDRYGDEQHREIEREEGHEHA